MVFLAAKSVAQEPADMETAVETAVCGKRAYAHGGRGRRVYGNPSQVPVGALGHGG